ncbi:MAG: PHP domain-containing protein [Candidatus Dormibacteraeota bacterium]|nr:PHP domain-containing protein [Candidatus Dormibacteraeota bacterium]
MRVDCQVHTVYSGDATTTLDQLSERIGEVGLDAVCITDHHTLDGALMALERRLGARVIVGEEVRTPAGEIIGLFLTERIPYVLPLLEAASRIRAQGGIVYAPHPCDRLRAGLGEAGLSRLAEANLLDVIEVFNSKVRHREDNAVAAGMARRLGVPGGAGSDAHDPEGIGAAYVEMADFTGPREFLDGLHRARIVGAFREHALRYAPRPRPPAHP